MSNLRRLTQYFCRLCILWNLSQTSQGESHTNLDSFYFTYQLPDYPRHCKEILNECSSSSSSGVYLIKPDGYLEPFEVFCNNDVNSGGWTVLQRRMDGSISFNRNWEEYKGGFGFLSTEFWLGNEKLSYISNQAVYELRIDLMLSNGSSFYIEYNAFRITDEWGGFSISSVGQDSGNESSLTTFCPPNTVAKNSICKPVHDTEIFTDCYHAYQSGHTEDGIYSIRPSEWTGEPFKAPCNMSIDGGGWTVLQRRVNGSVSFEHNWNEYKNGFGILEHELWLGNDKIYHLTKQKNYELRMDVVNSNKDDYFAKYNLFRISDENSKYQLQLGVYDPASTTGFDAMNQHRNQFFSTPDRDNDQISYTCGSNHRSGWWYGHKDGNNDCSDCHFTTPNIGTCSYPYPWWKNLPGSNCLMYTDIKIRPV
ncbi:Fibrinogen-like protein A [Holothuria leucospilota]|uniref:Fibrinogen-like protein A n=1 Tax=Holothuria leucospilota TaxID=206669 RepID=A0A9Q1BVT3_HOLLE|nr:Fibrinogen-like protein A [Holothuria leucospilota]